METKLSQNRETGEMETENPTFYRHGVASPEELTADAPPGREGPGLSFCSGGW